MNNLNITIANLVATAQSGEQLIKDNTGYVIHFTFDAQWDAYPLRSAVFVWNEDYRTVRKTVPFTGNTVGVPAVTGGSEVYVGVTAGELQTTTPARIPCRNSILSLEGSDPSPMPRDEFLMLTGALDTSLKEKLDIAGHAANLYLATDASGSIIFTEGARTGASAYEVALEEGFEGTAQEWLVSLKGEQGDPGKSAYQYAQEGGYTGTEEQFLEHMVANGKTAYAYALEGGFRGSQEEFAAKLASDWAPLEHSHEGYAPKDHNHDGSYVTPAAMQAYAQPKGNYLTEAPVQSVNGKTGAVQLGAEDVGALSEDGGAISGNLTLSGNLILTPGVNLFVSEEELPGDAPEGALYWVLPEEAEA